MLLRTYLLFLLMALPLLVGSNPQLSSHLFPTSVQHLRTGGIACGSHSACGAGSFCYSGNCVACKSAGCGIGSNCRVDQTGNLRCSCPKNTQGDPLTQCFPVTVCNDNSHCGNNGYCVKGRCIANPCATVQCARNTKCEVIQGGQVRCQPVPGCNEHSQCAENKRCESGSCVNPCELIECGKGAKCQVHERNPQCICPSNTQGNPQKQCVPVPACTGDATCGVNKVCQNGSCVNPCNLKRCRQGATCAVIHRRPQCICSDNTQVNKEGQCRPTQDDRVNNRQNDVNGGVHEGNTGDVLNNGSQAVNDEGEAQISNQEGNIQVNNLQGSNQINNQGGGTQAGNQGSVTQVSNEGGDAHVGNQGGVGEGSNQGGVGQGSNNGSGVQGSKQGGAAQGSNLGGAGQGSNQGGAGQGSNLGGAGQGSNQGGAAQGSNLGGDVQVSNQGGAGQGSNQGSAGQGSNQGSGVQVSNQGNAGLGSNQDGGVQDGNQGSTNQGSNQGVDAQVGNQTTDVDSQIRCVINSQCRSNERCQSGSCVNPCVFARCGEGARCQVSRRQAQCVCPENTQGNPLEHCQHKTVPDVVFPSNNPTQTPATNVSGQRIRNPGCLEVPDPGECRGAFKRFYYNNQTDQCDCFLFGGCDEEKIRFTWLTFEECQQECLPGNRAQGQGCKRATLEEVQTFLEEERRNRENSHN